MFSVGYRKVYIFHLYIENARMDSLYLALKVQHVKLINLGDL